MIVYSTEGGVDIEAVAENTPNLIFNEEIDPGTGHPSFSGKKNSFQPWLGGYSI